jgi:Uma2 family endonuclease
MAGKPLTRFETAGELLDSLGGVSPSRVRLKPLPGTATTEDVVRFLHRHKRKFELADGTLVEKIYSVRDSFVAVEIASLLCAWNDEVGRVGVIAGADGPFRLTPQLIRIPDVSFTNWDRLPGRRVPEEPVPDLAPNLAVEVLSEGNTPREMERKLKEYFLSEVTVVWFVNLKKRAVRVFTSPDNVTELTDRDTLKGGDVLPGFAVPVASLFADLGGSQNPPAKPKGKQPK